MIKAFIEIIIILLYLPYIVYKLTINANIIYAALI